MANHRAGKRETSRRVAAPTPRPPETRRATGTSRPTETAGPAAASRAVDAPGQVNRATGGRRKAAKPARSTRIRPQTAPAPAPLDPTPVRQAQPTRSGERKSLFPLLPSAPTLVGAAALLIAAGGAVTIGQNAEPAQASTGTIQRLSAQANVLTGSSEVGSNDAFGSRKAAVSRDSQREALQDAADQKLQAAAEAQAQERNAALAELAASAEKHADAIAAHAWQLPIAPGVYHLTAGFGDTSGLWAHTHTGLDFAAPSGTPIMSVASGVVSSTGYAGAYGNRTIVTLDDGTELWYCHQTSYDVSPGQHVSPGQVIGTVGATGNVTGPHLHLEVRPGAGDPVDPYTALRVHGLSP